MAATMPYELVLPRVEGQVMLSKVGSRASGRVGFAGAVRFAWAVGVAGTAGAWLGGPRPAQAQPGVVQAAPEAPKGGGKFYPDASSVAPRRTIRSR